MNDAIDLKQLARAAPEPPAPRRAWLTLVGLPAVLLAGFVALGLFALRGVFTPPRPVTVVPVLAVRGPSAEAEGTPLFRAAGWAEPRPVPTVVTALAEGVVEELLAVEGQDVARGQVVARLVRDEAVLALEFAEAELAQREAERVLARVTFAAAKARLESPLHLRAKLADAKAALARAETDLAGLPGKRRAAESRLEAARRAHARLSESGVVPEASVAKAKADLDAARAEMDELAARQKRLPEEAAALRDKADIASRRLEQLADEKRQVAEAEANAAASAAKVRQAEAARGVARLRLARMEVKAPVAGRVLALVARPGTRLTGLAPGSLHDTSTVLTMYDPARLQVRVDVRLEDVPRVRPGLKARIEAAALGGVSLDGEVLQATSQADIQKNTLAVKVAVVSPPGQLRPEMLCQVTFLAPPSAGGPAEDAVRLLIPRSLVDGERVWVADQAAGVARQRAVKLGRASGDLVEVLSGLSPTDKLIAAGRDGLHDGSRIAITGEDDSLGVR